MGMYQLSGIIVRHQDAREVDRLVTIYSQEQGMVTLRARGVRKISSKLAGSLEPLHAVTLTAVSGTTYDTITGAEILSTFPHIHARAERQAVAWFCASFVSAVSHERQHDSRVYQLLNTIYQVLETQLNHVDTRLLRWHFLWRLFVLLGHTPELKNCCVCRQPLAPHEILFSVKRGGLVHGRCRGVDGSAQPISLTTIKLLREICGENMRHILRLRYPASVNSEIDALTSAFASYTFERDVTFKPFEVLA